MHSYRVTTYQMDKENQLSLTPKQEAFCMAYIETGNASAAYRQSYDCLSSSSSTIHRRAKELLDNGKIGARIDELQNNHRLRHGITVDDIADQLDQDREFARMRNNASAALSATIGKARLYGLFNGKNSSAKTVGRSENIRTQSNSEKARIIAAALAHCAYSKENRGPH